MNANTCIFRIEYKQRELYYHFECCVEDKCVNVNNVNKILK